MKTIQSLALLAAAFITACSERQAATAPTGDVAALAPTTVIADRPYTWAVKCWGDLPSWASWSWTAAGVTIPGTAADTSCAAPMSPITGGGTRPASADGFSACVAGPTPGPATCRTWTFDPAKSFQAQLKGSGKKQVCALPYDPKRCWWETWSLSLNVDS